MFKLFILDNLAVLFHAPEVTQNVHMSSYFEEDFDKTEEVTKSNFVQFMLQMPQTLDNQSKKI